VVRLRRDGALRLGRDKLGVIPGYPGNWRKKCAAGRVWGRPDVSEGCSDRCSGVSEWCPAGRPGRTT